MTPRCEMVLRMYYGFHEPKATLAEIGERFAITPERVRQLIREALGRVVWESEFDQTDAFQTLMRDVFERARVSYESIYGPVTPP